MLPVSLLIHTRRHPSAILLLVQLLGMLLYPFIEGEPAGHGALNVFGVLVLALTIRMVRRTPGQTWVSVALAVPIVVLLALQTFFDMRGPLLPWSSALEALFYFYAAASLIGYMMGDRQATTDELFAAGATFTLLAWGFTHLYLMVQELHPGSFAGAVNVGMPRSWTELNYLSFALLSSTGIGDVIPLTVHARALCSIEMLVGVMYIAAVVARLIGFTTQGKVHRRHPNEAPEPWEKD
ncbi:ion channel [Telluria aromaticivorans]|uniref:Two pore domain potassium channel family protein n=1 Tax=Telluria aromaticivorans TaxID=2725995 RepID=A0A7Y2K105_9BURK|nr:potassium channel family protein [Telluria aromaticivorans]NNG24576.1 two pore domain potassium channel family protein [Telluria aromaticivorans]